MSRVGAKQRNKPKVNVDVCVDMYGCKPGGTYTLGTGVAAGYHSKRASGSRARSVPIGAPQRGGAIGMAHP